MKSQEMESCVLGTRSVDKFSLAHADWKTIARDLNGDMLQAFENMSPHKDQAVT